MKNLDFGPTARKCKVNFGATTRKCKVKETEI